MSRAGLHSFAPPSSGAAAGSASAASTLARVDWLEQALDRHALVMVGVLVVAAAGWAATGGPAEEITMILVAVMVAVLGLPHGAFDMEVGRQLLQPRHGRRWWPRFVGLYLAATAVVLAWWWIHPASALLSLLVLGIGHFGEEDLGPESDAAGPWRRGWRALGRGAVPVLAPLALRPAEVAEIFAILLGGSAAATPWLVDPSVLETVGIAGLIAAVPAIVDPMLRRGPSRLPLLEPAAVLLAAALMPPVAFFAVYFCLIHAVRHSLRSAAAHAPEGLGLALRGFVRATWPATAATVAGAIVVGVLVTSTDRMPAVDASIGIVFVGLHALTVPHVLLALVERRAGRLGDHP